MESPWTLGLRAVTLLATMALALALLPGTALAGSVPVDGPSTGVASVVAAGMTGATVAVPVDLGRTNPEFKIVCDRSKSGEGRVCYRTAPGRCSVYRAWNGTIRYCGSRAAGERNVML